MMNQINLVIHVQSNAGTKKLKQATYLGNLKKSDFDGAPKQAAPKEEIKNDLPF